MNRRCDADRELMFDISSKTFFFLLFGKLAGRGILLGIVVVFPRIFEFFSRARFSRG